MKVVDTYTANIYVGLRRDYSTEVSSVGFVETLCCEYCTRVGLCVTVTPTTFLYKDGYEPGAIVGLINYPRFPSTPKELEATALGLAALLKHNLHQQRVSIVFPDKTVMLGEE